MAGLSVRVYWNEVPEPARSILKGIREGLDDIGMDSGLSEDHGVHDRSGRRWGLHVHKTTGDSLSHVASVYVHDGQLKLWRGDHFSRYAESFDLTHPDCLHNFFGSLWMNGHGYPPEYPGFVDGRWTRWSAT